jgi:hypothetical protein
LNHAKGDDLNDIEGIIASLENQRAAIERALEALREVGGAGASAPKKGGRPPGKSSGPQNCSAFLDRRGKRRGVVV